MESYFKTFLFYVSAISFHIAVSTAQERLTNGFTTTYRRPAFTGAVYIKQEDTKVASKTTYIGPMCSASSIAEDRGFSSSYCLYNAWENVTLWNKVDIQRIKTPRSLRLIFGIESTLKSFAALKDLINNNDATDMEITNQNIRYPTGFNYSDQDDLFPKDIAMIKFPTLLRYNLHTNITNDTVVVGDTHTVLFAGGFGEKNCGSDSLQAQFTGVSIVDCPENTTKWPEQFCVNLTYNGTYSQESQGDWGGQVFQRTILEGGQIGYIQFGILSYQQKADIFGAGCTKAGRPQVATHISSFYNDFKNEYQGVVVKPLEGERKTSVPTLLDLIAITPKHSPV